MEQLAVLRSALVPMPWPDIDTDQIIPARFVKCRTEDEFSHALFRNRRDTDEDFVLNRLEMQGRCILFAGENFGCGSSREAAVWALRAGGFRAVISTGFGDIFRSNSHKNGLAPLLVTPEEHATVAAMLGRHGDVELTVDLRVRRVTWPDGSDAFPVRMDEFYRELLVEGRDELEYLLGAAAAIDAYESSSSTHPTVRRRLDDLVAWPELAPPA